MHCASMLDMLTSHHTTEADMSNGKDKIWFEGGFKCRQSASGNLYINGVFIVANRASTSLSIRELAAINDLCPMPPQDTVDRQSGALPAA